MSEQLDTQTHALRREALSRSRRGVSAERLVVLLAAFAVIGMLAGLGVSWLFHRDRPVTVIRQTPVLMPCQQAREQAEQNARLVFIDGSASRSGDTETDRIVIVEGGEARSGSNEAQ